MGFYNGYNRGYLSQSADDYDIRVVSVITQDEPVTLLEAKNYLRIDHTEDDDLITDMITQGRILAETCISKDILSKERELFTALVDRDIALPYAPINTTVDIVVEFTGVVVDENNYELLGLDEPFVRLFGPTADVTIKYTTQGITEGVKLGILAAIAYQYNQVVELDAGMINTNYETLLAPLSTLYI